MAVLEHLEPGRVFHFFEQMRRYSPWFGEHQGQSAMLASLPGRGACGISRMR